MAELGGIESCLFLIVMLQFAEAATEQRLTVRDGDEVTLPCDTVTEDQNKCDSIVWFFEHSTSGSGGVLLTKGQIDEAEDKSDRLSFSQKCSLVIKKVTHVDVGRYYCRQYGPGGQFKDSPVLLSVVSMTEETNGDEVTLNCFVRTRDQCPNTVKWTNGGQDVDKDMKTSQSPCFTSLSFKTSHVFYTSGDETVLVSVSVGAAALVAITLGLVAWRRTKGNKTKTDDEAADPDGGVAYASVSFTKNTAGRAQAALHPDDEDEGDAVTYTTLKPPRSSAAADPGDLYANVNRPAR